MRKAGTSRPSAAFWLLELDDGQLAFDPVGNELDIRAFAEFVHHRLFDVSLWQHLSRIFVDVFLFPSRVQGSGCPVLVLQCDLLPLELRFSLLLFRMKPGEMVNRFWDLC